MPRTNINDITRQFVKQGKYRFELTDKYGATIDQAIARDSKIQDLFSSSDNIHAEVMYRMALQRIERHSMDYISVYLFDGKLTISSDSVNVNFKCNSLSDAEKLIDLVCIGENLEPMPIYAI